MILLIAIKTGMAMIRLQNEIMSARGRYTGIRRGHDRWEHKKCDKVIEEINSKNILLAS